MLYLEAGAAQPWGAEPGLLDLGINHVCLAALFCLFFSPRWGCAATNIWLGIGFGQRRQLRHVRLDKPASALISFPDRSDISEHQIGRSRSVRLGKRKLQGRRTRGAMQSRQNQPQRWQGHMFRHHAYRLPALALGKRHKVSNLPRLAY